MGAHFKMGALDYLKSAASNFLSPGKKKSINVNENMNPNANLNPNPNINQNPIGGDQTFGTPKISQPKQFKPIINPHKDDVHGIGKDKYGHYVPTLTYPLPPLKWEKKQFELNRRRRNSRNDYI